MKRKEDNGKKSDHITVCICTYKRPKLLMHLLQAVCQQRTDGVFDYSTVVVDNDCAESVKDIVLGLKERGPIDIDYFCEVEQNISLARNKAIEKSRSDLVAFIDDDEFPEENWLLNLYNACKEFGADGVLGPVKPHFQVEPPEWIVKGKLFDRKTFATGSTMKDSKEMRTGNVLLCRNVINEKETAFDPRFGKTGGEDTDFFKRKLAQGYVFVWCDEAIVYETIPPERFTRAYFLRRALMRGVVNSRYTSFISFSTLKSLMAFVLYTSALPVFLLIGNQLFMRYLIKDCDHIGKLLALCGIKILKERIWN
ncbi:MAG: glycosyltransferase [Aliifodinibius sp.]|nr:glycosyltransferase family 2 protein [Fodinibius sp.]NIV14817.1 glycosyltransferase [Fodinibius sp.]NIY28696.1 glycosyltransferase [Fodinibius sp.]